MSYLDLIYCQFYSDFVDLNFFSSVKRTCDFKNAEKVSTGQNKDAKGQHKLGKTLTWS